MQPEGKLFDVIRNEHAHLRVLLDQTDAAARERGGHKSLKRAYELLRREMTRHSLAEEELLYPRMKEHEETLHFARVSVRQHTSLDRRLSRLDELKPGDIRWEQHFEVLRTDLLEHLELEEENVFPSIAGVFSELEMGRIASGMRRFFEAERAA